MKIIRPPNKIPKLDVSTGTVFMGGTISNWRDEFKLLLQDTDVVLLDPVVENYSPSEEQVSWEFDAMNRAHILVFYFDKTSVSPISLMELGWAMHSLRTVLVGADPDYPLYSELLPRYNIMRCLKIECSNSVYDLAQKVTSRCLTL